MVILKKCQAFQDVSPLKKMLDVPVSDGFSGVQLVLEPSKSHEHALSNWIISTKKNGMKNDKGLKHQQLSKS